MSAVRVRHRPPMISNAYLEILRDHQREISRRVSLRVTGGQNLSRLSRFRAASDLDLSNVAREIVPGMCSRTRIFPDFETQFEIVQEGALDGFESRVRDLRRQIC